MADEAILKRVLPHSVEAEQAVISGMLTNRESILTASEMLTGKDFYNRQYGIIFDAMVELYEHAQEVDLITLPNKLKEKDLPPEVSSMDYIREAFKLLPHISSKHIERYAKIVAEKAVLRQMIQVNEDIANTCYTGKEPLDSVLQEAEKRIFKLVQSQSGGDFEKIDKIVYNAMSKIEAASKLGGAVTGIPTGFIDLDYQTAGMQPSDLVLIAARPSMGKTAFVLNIAQHVAFKENKPVAIFSLEMSKEQLVNRMFALESSVDAQKIRTGNLSDEDWEKLVEGASVIAKSSLIIDDTSSISIPELRSKCTKFKAEHGLAMIIIDYLQLMSGGGRSSDSRQQEISEISRSLKSIARDLQVPVLALSQLSRAVEQRQDKRPMLSDLRESGAIEQDADVVMFIYRDDYYNKDSDKKGIAEIIIAKQRNGPIGTVELVWLPEYTKFANAEHSKNNGQYN